MHRKPSRGEAVKMDGGRLGTTQGHVKVPDPVKGQARGSRGSYSRQLPTLFARIACGTLTVAHLTPLETADLPLHLRLLGACNTLYIEYRILEPSQNGRRRPRLSPRGEPLQPIRCNNRYVGSQQYLAYVIGIVLTLHSWSR